MPDRRQFLALVLSLVATTACSRPAAAPADTRPPIVLQGAMDIEVTEMVAALSDVTKEQEGGWTFWRGTLDGYPVIVSKTLKGMENAAAATALAASRYHPRAIVNQGTAGGHQPDLHVFDIVIGREAVHAGSFRSGVRAKGAGSVFAEWMPLDLNATEGSAGADPRAHVMHRFMGDAGLLAAAHAAAPRYGKGKVVDGVIGSADMWNSELDRIEALHARFGTTVEEMETAAAAQIAGLFDVPFLGIRVLSNNITNGDVYDRTSGAACQAYVLDVARTYIATLE